MFESAPKECRPCHEECSTNCFGPVCHHDYSLSRSGVSRDILKLILRTPTNVTVARKPRMVRIVYQNVLRQSISTRKACAGNATPTATKTAVRDLIIIRVLRDAGLVSCHFLSGEMQAPHLLTRLPVSLPDQNVRVVISGECLKLWVIKFLFLKFLNLNSSLRKF